MDEDLDVLIAGAGPVGLQRRGVRWMAIDQREASDASVVDHERFPLLRDAAGEFRAAYDARGCCLYPVRPDRYVAFRTDRHDAAALGRYLDRILVARDAG